MITQPIVVGVDGSPESAAAASVGWRFARAAGVSCRLAHAANDVSAAMEFAGTGVMTETLQLAALTRARANVSASLRECVAPELVDSMVVSTGGTTEVLAAVVRERTPRCWCSAASIIRRSAAGWAGARCNRPCGGCRCRCS